MPLKKCERTHLAYENNLCRFELQYENAVFFLSSNASMRFRSSNIWWIRRWIRMLVEITQEIHLTYLIHTHSFGFGVQVIVCRLHTQRPQTHVAHTNKMSGIRIHFINYLSPWQTCCWIYRQKHKCTHKKK